MAALATTLAALAACGNVGAGSCWNNAACAQKITGAGQIVIQLFDTPGFTYPSVNGVPEWTLYGDNTLVFQGNTSTSGQRNTSTLGQSQLVSVKLTSGQAAHILDVVVNQYHFFASNQSTYGHRIPDAGLTALYVDDNGRQKMVDVGGTVDSPDAQTQNVFDIVQFLRGYTPSSAQPYAPSGVALLAIAQGQATANETAWPVASVSLKTVASSECTLLGAATCAGTASQPGVSATHGSAATDLLRIADGRGTFAQGGESYFVIIWPLMPDALYPPTGKSASVRVARAGGDITSWPLIG